ncbi:MAG TPA: MFS transporter [Gaiellaceae bacterium]|nr:MFS transporter [Gaiellaceae bacterium]
MRSALTRMSQSAGALAAVFRNRDLRRLELAWVGSVIGSWAYLVALAVYAYGEGGAAAVGLVGVIRLLPSALAAPFVAVAADRFPRERVMVVTDLIRVPLMAAVAITILWDGPAAIVYVAVGLTSVVGTAFRPAQAALLPSLARTPEELSAANVTSSTVESIGTFVGPALGGILLAATSPEIVFGVNALTFVWSALMVAGIRAVAQETSEPAGPAERGSFKREVGAGFRTFAVERDLRLIVALYGAQTIVAGAFTVLMVVASLELLDMGEAGFGFLNSAVGIGGLVGAVLALALAMRGRLATDFALGVALYGAPLALVVVWQEPVAALVLMGLVGVGNTLTDVAALTLMQRAVPDEVLARAFGALESVLLGCLGLGAVLGPVLVETLGIETALVVAGGFLPVVILLSVPALARIDTRARVPAERIALVAAHPIFAPLAPATIEQLAGRLTAVSVSAGDEIIRRGDRGDHFYLVDSGQVEAQLDDRVALLESGEGFGEIALLRDVPRTATVVARTDAELLALDRDDFLAAVTRDPYSRSAADDVVAGRLGSFSPGVAPT